MENHWNQKVVANRGKGWRKAIISGRLEAGMNPTNIRIARIKKGLTQTEVATDIGLTYATYGAIEVGKRSVKTDRASKIVELLGLKMNRAFDTLENGKHIARKGK